MREGKRVKRLAKEKDNNKQSEVIVIIVLYLLGERSFNELKQKKIK